VTTQVALTLALLGGSALLLRSLWNVVNVQLGFAAEHVVTLSTTLSATRHPTSDQVTAFFEELLARAQAVPGTVSAALSDAPAPRGRVMGRAQIGIDMQPVDADARHAVVRIREVTPGYFETFRTPLVSGRTFGEADRDGELAVVLSESAERILFRGERALDRRVQPYPEGPWYTVVGVAADVRNGPRIIDEPEPEIYAVARRGAWGQAPAVAIGRMGHIALRTTADPVDASLALRQIVTDLDPRLAVTIETVEEQVTRLSAQQRFAAWLLTAFAALALLLAAAGLYSVASYLVTQRRRDIGVRIAVGAAPGALAQHLVGEATRWCVAGVPLGCVLGWMATRALQSQLYNVQPFDLWSWVGAVATLGLTLLVAVARPAYQAAHVDPVLVLRAD
jgi:putative ABC transport system permease protein